MESRRNGPQLSSRHDDDDERHVSRMQLHLPTHCTRSVDLGWVNMRVYNFFLLVDQSLRSFLRLTWERL